MLFIASKSGWIPIFYLKVNIAARSPNIFRFVLRETTTSLIKAILIGN
jgi:hypothetical protein